MALNFLRKLLHLLVGQKQAKHFRASFMWPWHLIFCSKSIVEVVLWLKHTNTFFTLSGSFLFIAQAPFFSPGLVSSPPAQKVGLLSKSPSLCLSRCGWSNNFFRSIGCWRVLGGLPWSLACVEYHINEKKCLDTGTKGKHFEDERERLIPKKWNCWAFEQFKEELCELVCQVCKMIFYLCTFADASW